MVEFYYFTVIIKKIDLMNHETSRQNYGIMSETSNFKKCKILKGTKLAVFGVKGIHSTLYWKGSIASAGIRTPGLWSERSTTELSDLRMNGHKNSVHHVQNTLFTSQSGICNCHKMTNCEQFKTKCCVKISATLTLASTHVFLIKMCQDCYNRRESRVF